MLDSTMLNLKNITLEGPDLSGKTTLMSQIHKETNNKYNIIDRSTMSAMVYSTYYDRPNVKLLERQLRNELNNLNNRTIILMPDIKVLNNRYNDRGDEIQNWEDIIAINNLYEQIIKKFGKFSTLKVIRSDQPLQEALDYLETSGENIPQEVLLNAIASDDEAYPVKLEVDLGDGFMTAINDAFDFESEKEYYTKILSKMLTTITKENIGDNPYGTRQDPKKTRRYIYADDSCIALFHMMYREDRLNFYATLRSSDVVNIFEHDYKFLKYLCGECAKAVGIKDYEIPKETTLSVIIHSAHII
ncbi:MAG: hypothetical protein CMB47_03325 [Euryarchaeota archaeon]|nr:hypothetical protein [Euryarchaeota archaeon]